MEEYGNLSSEASERLTSSSNRSEPVVKLSWLRTTYYDNPWSSWRFPSLLSLIRSIPGWWRKPARPKDHIIEEELRVETPSAEQLSQPPTDGSLQLTWLGHATCLVQLDGLSVLTDPVMSERCSFSQYVGYKRYTRAPLQVQDLPEIDAVVISHNHYDHLDLTTVMQLHNTFQHKLKWFVPLGHKSWFTACGIDNVTELSWWGSAALPCKSGGEVKVVCVPAQHWSNRFLHDKCVALWSGWVLVGRDSRFYFAGDTGYCEAFKEIGREYGPFTAAAIPIGAYCPRVMMQGQHVDPGEAVRVHQDVRSHKSIGIHWGTFDLSAEGIFEPRDKLKECVRDAGLNPADFITLQHGQTISVTSNFKTGELVSGPQDGDGDGSDVTDVKSNTKETNKALQSELTENKTGAENKSHAESSNIEDLGVRL